MANTREHISLRLSTAILDEVRKEMAAFEKLTGVKRSMASVIEARLNIAYQDHPIDRVGIELKRVIEAKQPEDVETVKRRIVEQIGADKFGPIEFHPPASGVALLHKLDALERHAVNCKCLICKPPKPPKSSS